MSKHKQVDIHRTAEVSERAMIGPGTSVWHQAQVREGAQIGHNCILGKGVYIDKGVVIGDTVKIQNYVSVYNGITLEEGVFCGPHVVFTNDKRPRAMNWDDELVTDDEWEVVPTRVHIGASIGAGAVILCGVTIGHWAMVGAGAVVTHDVPDYGLVRGNPAKLCGFVCCCGHPLELWMKADGGDALAQCTVGCGGLVAIEMSIWESVDDSNF